MAGQEIQVALELAGRKEQYVQFIRDAFRLPHIAAARHRIDHLPDALDLCRVINIHTARLGDLHVLIKQVGARTVLESGKTRLGRLEEPSEDRDLFGQRRWDGFFDIANIDFRLGVAAV